MESLQQLFQTNGWLPIEQAPKDGTAFYCYGYGVTELRAVGTGKWCNDVNDVKTLGGQPLLNVTHFMPLEAPELFAKIIELLVSGIHDAYDKGVTAGILQHKSLNTNIPKMYEDYTNKISELSNQAKLSIDQANKLLENIYGN